MRYHIHTENFPNVAELASRHFDGFTLTPAIGYWKGQPESSILIEVLTDNLAAVHALADELKATNHQESVLIETEDVRYELT